MGDVSGIGKVTELIAQLSVDRASQVLSKMVKSGSKIILEKTCMADICEITERINAKGGEVMGAYVDLLGDAPFKFLFYVEAKDSLVITDLILRKEIGTTKDFGLYTKSAVQEMGNILASAVCNVFSKDFNIIMKPSPPNVVHDFVGTIFQEYVMGVAAQKDEVLIIESKFCVVYYDIKCDMFVLPLPGSENTLNQMCGRI